MESRDQFLRDEECRQFHMACVVWIAGWTLVLCIAFSGNFLPEWRLNHRYLQTEAEILDKHLRRRTDGEGGWEYEAEFRIRYLLLGGKDAVETRAYYQAYPQPRDHDTAKTLCDGFTIGRKYPCWYDPDDPQKAALSRSYSTHAVGIVYTCSAVLLASMLWMLWRQGRPRRILPARLLPVASVAETE
jgi:hypothetical protein